MSAYDERGRRWSRAGFPFDETIVIRNDLETYESVFEWEGHAVHHLDDGSGPGRALVEVICCRCEHCDEMRDLIDAAREEWRREGCPQMDEAQP